MAKVFDEKMMKSTKKGINNRAPPYWKSAVVMVNPYWIQG